MLAFGGAGRPTIMKHFGKLLLTLPGRQVRQFDLSKSKISLGHSPSNDIALEDPTVSSSHARIECTDTDCFLKDLDSECGTFVNGLAVQNWSLNPGDEIKLGEASLRFERVEPNPNPSRTVLETTSMQLDLAALAEAHLTTTLSETSEDQLIVVTAKGTWDLPLADVNEVAIGRQQESDIVLELPGVSRHHARIERHGSEFIVRDQGSTNGTWLGNRRIESYSLQDGDTLRVGGAQLVFKRGFQTETLFDQCEVPDFVAPSPRKAEARQPIVVVPAMCGSELWQGDERVWPSLFKVIQDPHIVKLPDQTPLEPRAIVEDVCIVPNIIKLEKYGRLREFLEQGLGYERGKDLLEFPYDWRQDVRVSARRLAKVLDDWPVFCKPPITIIAHSLGCLVARYYVERLGGKDKVDRLVLIGGPHRGAPLAVSRMYSHVDYLPFGFRSDGLREALVTFPSIYQLLPTYACGVDQNGREMNVLLDDSWLPREHRPLLAKAREFRRELGTKSSVPALSVFGYGLKTITGMNVEREPDGSWSRVEFTEEPAGDNSTPEYSAVLDPTHMHPVRQYHGSLYIDQDVQKRLKIELMR